MPLDSITVSALADELRGQIVGAKIDKVQQPERNTVILSLRSQTGTRRLLLCCGVGIARVHFTEATFENPAQPPMFCMLLRKHISGAVITELEQPLRERILVFHLDAFDEMGVRIKKKLVLEMIGRGTNLVLIDSENRIIDCLRRVDLEMSEIRQILPGLLYRLPLRQAKPDFFALTHDDRATLWETRDQNVSSDKWLLDSFSCLSPLLCRELEYQSLLPESNMLDAMDNLANAVENHIFSPCMLLIDNKPKDFSFQRIEQYGNAMACKEYDSFSSLLDSFFTQRSKAEEMRHRTADLRKTVKNARDRISRKILLQSEDLKKTSERDLKRRYGDLITANLYRAPQVGSGSMMVEDFYEENSPTVVIPLDRRKTAQQNAASYYKEYTKAKTAEGYLTKLIAGAKRDEDYLNSVLDEIDRVETEADIMEIRKELTETGYIKTETKKNKSPHKENKPFHYRSSSGYDILAGKNNIQNDLLTRNSHRGDIWLHTQKIHGSHVIISCEGDDVDMQTLQEAAMIAAYHSQAANGGKVPVDYTRIRYVKKPNNSLPGMVTYTDYSTIIVEADSEKVNNLIAK